MQDSRNSQTVTTTRCSLKCVALEANAHVCARPSHTQHMSGVGDTRKAAPIVGRATCTARPAGHHSHDARRARARLVVSSSSSSDNHAPIAVVGCNNTIRPRQPCHTDLASPRSVTLWSFELLSPKWRLCLHRVQMTNAMVAVVLVMRFRTLSVMSLLALNCARNVASAITE